MKKIVILYMVLIFAFSFAVCGSEKIFAVGEEYARIIDEETPFYSDKSALSPLFYLPYTYYVRVIEKGETLSHVECYGNDGTARIDGYVPTSKLFFDGLAVINPYPSITVTSICTAGLYDEAETTKAMQYIFEGRAMRLYGKLTLTNGTNVYYVSYNERLGYVKEEDIMPFALPQHPNELTFIKKEEPSLPAITEEPQQPEEKPSETDDGTLNLKILIIASLGFAGIIGLFIAFRKKPKNGVCAGYYDENDYE